MGRAVDEASSSHPADLGGFLKVTLLSQGQVSSRSANEGACPNARAQGSVKATRMLPREEPRGGREGPFWQEARGGWTVLSSISHETSPYGRWWVTCRTVPP